MNEYQVPSGSADMEEIYKYDIEKQFYDNLMKANSADEIYQALETLISRLESDEVYKLPIHKWIIILICHEKRKQIKNIGKSLTVEWPLHCSSALRTALVCFPDNEKIHINSNEFLAGNTRDEHDK